LDLHFFPAFLSDVHLPAFLPAHFRSHFLADHLSGAQVGAHSPLSHEAHPGSSSSAALVHAVQSA